MSKFKIGDEVVIIRPTIKFHSIYGNYGDGFKVHSSSAGYLYSKDYQRIAEDGEVVLREIWESPLFKALQENEDV